MGTPGCVDGNTEYFNGVEWKKISTYTEGDKVLQFNVETNEATLVKPLKYIKEPCNSMYFFQDDRLCQCLSSEHKVIFYEKNDFDVKYANEFYKEYIRGKFNGKFKLSFDYEGNGVKLSNKELINRIDTLEINTDLYNCNKKQFEVIYKHIVEKYKKTITLFEEIQADFFQFVFSVNHCGCSIEYLEDSFIVKWYKDEYVKIKKNTRMYKDVMPVDGYKYCFTVPTHALVLRKNGKIFITGNSGKTYFLLNMCANCLGMGQRVIAIDPKNDLDKLKNVDPRIEIIDINDIRPGALNPFTFLSRCDATTLLTVVESICGKLDKKDIIDITPIIKDFVTEYNRDGEYRDMQDVADYLYSNPSESAQRIGSMLRLNEDSKYGKLLFTRETNIEPLRIPKDKSLVISIHGMALPDHTKDPNDYNAEERFTSTILYLITKKLNEILSDKNKIPTTFVCDEAHILFANKEMSIIIHNFLALGRSLNIAVALASQGINHFPNNIAQFMSSKFVFRSSMEEARAFLEKFDTSKLDLSKALDTPSVIMGITSLQTGQCFFIDWLGRSGYIQIESIWPKEALTSNPLELEQKRKKELENQQV